MPTSETKFNEAEFENPHADDDQRLSQTIYGLDESGEAFGFHPSDITHCWVEFDPPTFGFVHLARLTSGIWVMFREVGNKYGDAKIVTRAKAFRDFSPIPTTRTPSPRRNLRGA